MAQLKVTEDKVILAGTEHPVCHELRHCGWGWCVSAHIINGLADKRHSFQGRSAERKARAFFDALPGTLV